ncbi:MAG: hypothetical protein JWQ38_3411 [Flavipsychrobacter sp.]|nr:hypothetical protein [Flavipsychrobacter sp.]
MNKYYKPGQAPAAPAQQQAEHPQQPSAPRGELTAELIREEMERLSNLFKERDPGVIRMRTGGNTMEHSMGLPAPAMLFSEFWHEGELCILFADTNLGKSILAVQIADSISRGVPVPGFKLEVPPQVIIYLDFELSDKQFANRYTGPDSCHPFSDNFYRGELNPDADMPDHFGTYEQFLFRSIEEAIMETGATVLIVDNITYLRSETEKAKDALPLMKELKGLKQRYNLSILALAHTPKRNNCMPITKNDLQGSKMLINFCDSAFAIGESNTNKHVRYLKQIKQRYTECVYDANNVCVCITNKPDNFLQFELQGYATEREHLTTDDAGRDQRIAQAKDMSAQGMSQRQIAKELNISVASVNSYLKK